MVRDAGAVLAGLFVGSIANMAVLSVSWALYPMPEGMDMSDSAQMSAYVASLPVMALLWVIVAHMSQAFFGGMVAARLAESDAVRAALIVALLTMVGGVLNMINIGGPLWMWLEMPLYLVFGWLAGMAELKRRDL